MNDKLSAEIQAEQEHGRQKYGRGPNDLAHDDDHARADWPRFIIDHAERASLATFTPMEWRQRMVKIAGLAISAIESFDRQQALTPPKRREEGVER